MMAMSLFVLCCTIYWVSVEFLRPWTVWKIREAREEFIKAVKSWEQSASEKTIGASILGKDEDADHFCACADVEDACSRSSCPHCSPVKSHFGFDREAALVVRSKHNPTKDSTNSHLSSPYISNNEVSSSKSTHSSLEHQANPTPVESSILRKNLRERALHSALHLRRPLPDERRRQTPCPPHHNKVDPLPLDLSHSKHHQQPTIIVPLPPIHMDALFHLLLPTASLHHILAPPPNPTARPTQRAIPIIRCCHV
jgi:hypothetical protein